MTKITIDRAVVEQALHVATAAGYPVALIAALRAALAEPQEPVAVHQFRKRGSIDWFDGHPDHTDGGGPYVSRTLYLDPPQRPAEPVQEPTVTGYGVIKGRKYINNKPVEEPVQEQCKGAPGECEFNGGCMYACAKPEPPIGQASTDVPVPVYVLKKAAPVQEPAFHGFMSADGTRVDLCFTPSAPRSDGTYATAYYAAPPQRPAEPVQEPAIPWGKAIGAEQKRGCRLCGIGAAPNTAMGYVCPRMDCPTRVTCGVAA